MRTLTYIPCSSLQRHLREGRIGETTDSLRTIFPSIPRSLPPGDSFFEVMQYRERQTVFSLKIYFHVLGEKYGEISSNMPTFFVEFSFVTEATR